MLIIRLSISKLYLTTPTLFILSLLIALLVFTAVDVKAQNIVRNLTKDSSKSWRLIQSRSVLQEVCPSLGEIVFDNEYIFSNDGRFVFDPGKITKDQNCVDCCSDLEAMLGNWEIRGNNLLIMISHLKSNLTEEISFNFITGEIEKIEEDSLLLKVRNEESNEDIRIEFIPTL